MLMHSLASNSVDVSKYGLGQESSVVPPLPKVPKGSCEGVSHVSRCLRVVWATRTAWGCADSRSGVVSQSGTQ
jgi:hypothetical protein